MMEGSFIPPKRMNRKNTMNVFPSEDFSVTGSSVDSQVSRSGFGRPAYGKEILQKVLGTFRRKKAYICQRINMKQRQNSMAIVSFSEDFTFLHEM